MSAILRLVVDNVSSETGDVTVEAEDGIGQIIRLLEEQAGLDVTGTWLKCISFSPNGVNNYHSFMQRNWERFEPLFLGVRHNDHSRRHRLVNYFMMLVYLETVKGDKTPGNDTVQLKENSKLLPWVVLFADDILEEGRRERTDLVQRMPSTGYAQIDDEFTESA